MKREQGNWFRNLRHPKGLSAILAVILFSSCHNYLNPVDPRAATYQGYLTVRSVNDVVPDTPLPGESTWWFIFYCSLCPAADAYAMQLSSSPTDFSSPVYEISSSTTNRMVIPNPDLPLGNYYWCVRAHDMTANQWGPWSASSSVTLGETLPGIAPANGVQTADLTPLLDWDDVNGATGYQLQTADTDAGLTGSAEIDLSSSQHEITTPFALGTTHYWRIRPVDVDGIRGIWSSAFHFTVTLLPGILVQGGSYQMGSTSGYSDEQPVHSVTVSNFYISKYEVTQSEYQQIIGTNPSSFTSSVDAPYRPVEQVSWDDAVAFCNALSDLEGLQRIYTINGATVTVDWTKNGYRLPTEAEWEYAARGGNQSQDYRYSGSNDLNAVAWHSSNSGDTTHPVGSKGANELGIYDMSGNVREWCWDWYGSYSGAAQTDPQGPLSGSYRVLRGGSWSFDLYFGGTRSTYRYPLTYLGFRYDSIGFRPVRRAD